MKIETLVILGILGFVLFQSKGSGGKTIAQKRAELVQKVLDGGDDDAAKQRVATLFQTGMTDAEIAVVYGVIFGGQTPGQAWNAISVKYNIFT